MRSSAKRFRWLMITLLTLFTVLCVGFTGFFAACKKDKDEEEEPEPEVTVEHTHDYTATWDWGTDYTTCDVTLTCTSTEGECDTPTVKDTVTTTSEETTKATCEGTGLQTCTATYEYDGKTYTDTKTETLAALGHAWPANDDAENVDWQWESRTDEVVSLVVTCERCGVTLLDEEVKYDTDSTSGTTDILSAEYEVDETLTYTSGYNTVNDPAEHAHHYEPTAWNWSDAYTTCEVTLTCGGVVGECPENEKTITTDAEVTSEDTIPATCEEEGEMTYTATLEYDGHTYTDTKTETIGALGHDYDAANATWEWTIDSEGKATATVTIACSRDSSHAAWSSTQTDIEIDTDGLYHAFITGPDGITQLTDDYKEIEVQKEYHIDFSDPDTYTWIGTPTSTGEDENGETFLFLENLSSTYTTGILTYVASGASVNKENAGALFTSTASGTYFELDLSAFEGLYVSVSVTMSTNSDTAARSLYINTDKSTSTGIKSVTSSNKTDYQTLEYGKVISEGETLYLTWSGNIRIFEIEIEIMDPEDVTPEVREVTLDKTSLFLYVEGTDYLTATVEMTIGNFAGTYEWSSSDETIARVEGSGNGATVIAVSAGTAIITVKVGDKEATCTVTVREKGEGTGEYAEESFIVSLAGSLEGASDATYSANTIIEDNSLFTLTADVSMKYYTGEANSSQTYGNLQNGSNAVSFTDMNGVVHNPDQGIEQSSDTAAGSTTTDIISLTAKEDVHVYIYLTFTNNSFNSDRASYILYTVDGGNQVSVDRTGNDSKKRKNVTTIEVDLLQGQTVIIGVQNTDSNNG